MPDIINVVIENCNSIERAEVTLKTGGLNIKYGPNGIGKSTIAKAICSQVKGDNSLAVLKPFKYIGQENSPEPCVTGVDDISSALVFDEIFVNQFVFQRDEVLQDSFNIFIKNAEYEAMTGAIEELLAGIKKSIKENADIENILKDLRDLKDAFGKTTSTGEIPNNSKVFKAYGAGNKIEHVPATLVPYTPYLQGANPSGWIGWQIKGKEFLDLAEKCPYCAKDFPSEDTKETILMVAKEYDSRTIENLNNIKAVIARLGQYFSGTCKENLSQITSSKTEMSKEQKLFLSQLSGQIGILITKFEDLRSISFFTLRDVDAVDDAISGLSIDLKSIDKLDSQDTRKVVDPINRDLRALLDRIGQLKGNVNSHKARIQNTIAKNQASINNFLKTAGYKYSVKIVPEGDSYRMKLVHEDMDEHIQLASNHLSYGEKNAFALVLFMHQVRSEKPALVILDDPISSFDKHKKFAILNELFQGEARLNSCTTLMLTHDFEPVIDLIFVKHREFQDPRPCANHLIFAGGNLSEIGIVRSDIQTFTQICKANIAGNMDDIVKCIYLRRLYEILDDSEPEYQVLSSLLHKRVVPDTKLPDGSSVDMPSQDRLRAEANIRVRLPEFNYEALLLELNDVSKMVGKYRATNIGYEKLQLFRIIMEGRNAGATIVPDSVHKFVNEAFHIENESVVQLNPHKYESVPEFVLTECTRIINSL